MRYRIQLSDKAEIDVDAVLAWFRDQRATEAGRRWFADMWTVLDTLERNPDRCSLAPESEKSETHVYELLFGRRRTKYRILFEIYDGTVHILRVRHSARDRLGLDDL